MKVLDDCAATKHNIFRVASGHFPVMFVAAKASIFKEMSGHFPAIFAVIKHVLLRGHRDVFQSCLCQLGVFLKRCLHVPTVFAAPKADILMWIFER